MQNYTINDIARISGFSRGTVSRVLNRDKRVRPTTRAKIEKVIKELHYQPNVIARGLVNGKMDMVALLMSDVRNPFFAGIAYYVQNIMREYGYMVVLFNSNSDAESEKQTIRVAREMNFQGIFLISSMSDATEIQDICSDKCPMVLLHRQLRGFEGDFVVQDNFHAGYIVTNHLIEQGHDRIAFLAGPKTSASSVGRVDGFRNAMQNAMLTVEDDQIYEGDFTLEKGLEFGQLYLQHLDTNPGAVLCGNDMMAIGFLEACKNAKIQVPEDISVASFDDIELAGLKSVQLTTVHQPVYEMCKKACEIMVNRIAGEQSAVNRVMLNPTLVIRNTVGHARTTK